VGGKNYGQGSSREHAALAPRYLGLAIVVAKSFARIHWQNLVNWGVLPLTITRQPDYDMLEPNRTLRIENIAQQLRSGSTVRLSLSGECPDILAEHQLSPTQIEILVAGGLVNFKRRQIRALSEFP
jgi:aconitate hydratase